MRAGGKVWRCGLWLAWVCFAPAVVDAHEPRRERLRAGYLPVAANRAIAVKMRAAGLNAVWPKLTFFRPDGEDENSLRRIEQWHAACSQNELQLWPVVNFAGGPNELEFFPDFRREVSPTGLTNSHTPCPVDEAYWRKVIFPRFLKVAELSKTRPSLAGMVLDLEMYGADHAGYAVPCACESCCQEAGSDKPAALRDWQRQETERLSRDLERQVHHIAPQFQFAAMHLEEPFPFYEGLALGWGTAERPVVCAAERTYATGHTSEVDETRRRFRELSAHVAFAGGLSLTAFRAEQVAPQLYSLGTQGDGFWLYTLGSLALPNEQVEAVYRLPDPQPEYWSAFREAHDELDRFITSSGAHQSPLVARREPAESRVTLTKRVLEPVSTDPPPPRPPADEMALRNYNIALVLLRQDETLRLRVTGLAVGKQPQPGELKVLDPDGRALLSRLVPLGDSTDIELTAKTEGTHWITTNMGLHACQLSVSNPHAVYFATRHQRLKAHRSVRPLYFLVRDNQTPTVEIATEGPAEAVIAKLLNPRGEVAVEKLVAGNERLTGSGPAGVWSLVIAAGPNSILEDVAIGLPAPLAPYFADAPERLLRDKR